MIYYAILIVAHTPRVIAEANGTDELVERLRNVGGISIDAVAAGVIARACNRSRTEIENVSQCELPLADGGRLFIQYRGWKG